MTQEAWKECRETFGPGNVLIVSNTAGSHTDVGEIEVSTFLHLLVSRVQAVVPDLLRPSP